MSNTVAVTPDKLEMFGLSNYESRVYLSLLLGDKTAKEIVDDSEVPTGRIYDVLSSLENKGITEKQDSRPKKFIAIDPEIVLQKLLSQQEARLSLLKKESDNIETQLTQLKKQKSKEEVKWSVALFSDPQVMMRHSKKIEKAKTELLIHLDLSNLTQNTPIQGMVNFIRSVQEVANQVDKKIILGGISKKNLKDILSENYTYLVSLTIPIKVRISEYRMNTFDIIDAEKVLVKTMNPVKSGEFFSMVYVWHTTFANELRNIFFDLWEKGEEISVQVV